jgi:oligopeptide/dipeptide ABC transporter ATP-binding protein
VSAPVLEVRDLVKDYPVRRGVFGRTTATVHAVDKVSFTIGAGQTLGLVGESGCGKSTVGRSVLRLVEPTSGTMLLNGDNITALGTRELRARRRHMQMVFQNPYGSLNPRLSVARNVAEPLRIQRSMSRVQRLERAEEVLAQVGLSSAMLLRLPAELSGGQRQRAAIARALALGPDLLILDEPVSSLDVSVRAQVLNILRKLQAELNIAYLFISHDLAVVRHICSRVVVMYLGRVMEEGDVDDIFAGPTHPYTRALMSAVPEPDPTARETARRIVLTGEPPSPSAPPTGCPFRTRCWKATQVCASTEPPLVAHGAVAGHRAACHHPETGG